MMCGGHSHRNELCSLIWPKRCLFRYNRLSFVTASAPCAHSHFTHNTPHFIPAFGFLVFPHLQPKFQYSLLFFLQSTAEQVLCLLALKSVHELEPHIWRRDIQRFAEAPPGSTSYDNSGRWRVSSCSQVRGCSEEVVRADFSWGIQQLWQEWRQMLLLEGAGTSCRTEWNSPELFYVKGLSGSSFINKAVACVCKVFSSILWIVQETKSFLPSIFWSWLFTTTTERRGIGFL